MPPQLSLTHPLARKPHTCRDCGKTIPKGARYRRENYRDQYEMYSLVSCRRCCIHTATVTVYGFDPDQGCLLIEAAHEDALGQWREYRKLYRYYEKWLERTYNWPKYPPAP